jgi:hypothetical protein
MKMLILLFACALFFVTISCEPPVAFSEPQPAGSENLAAFPGRLLGSYINPIDNSLLVIQRNIITRAYDYEVKMHVHELDSNTKLEGHTLVNLETNEKTIIRREGDTLIERIQYIDTIFRMSYDDVARKLKGHYFLNIRCAPQRWQVKELSLSKGKLSLGSINSKEEIQSLQTITESSADTAAPFTFNVTRKQFKTFVKQDGFRDREVFMRVKKR